MRRRNKPLHSPQLPRLPIRSISSGHQIVQSFQGGPVDYTQRLPHDPERNPAGGGLTESWRLHPLVREHCARQRFSEAPERFRRIQRRLAEALVRRGETVPAMQHAMNAAEELLAHARAAELTTLVRYLAALRIAVLVIAGRIDDAERAWRRERFPDHSEGCVDLAGQTWREMEAVLLCGLPASIPCSHASADWGLPNLPRATTRQR